MYNMEISIGSYKFRLEIVLIIIFLLVVMFGHTLCACSHVGLMEGLVNIAASNPMIAAPKPMIAAPKGKATKGTAKEGFSNYKTVAGPQFAENDGNFSYIDPSKWAQPSLVYTAGVTPDAGVQSVLDRGKTQAPLAEGEMDFFANTQFKPECCPNTYSNSQGCACMSVQQNDTLIHRGSNNVPYSEY